MGAFTQEVRGELVKDAWGVGLTITGRVVLLEQPKLLVACNEIT